MSLLLDEQKMNGKAKDQKYRLKIKEIKTRYKKKIIEYETYVSQLKA